jgi:hypothetical protein
MHHLPVMFADALQQLSIKQDGIYLIAPLVARA